MSNAVSAQVIEVMKGDVAVREKAAQYAQQVADFLSPIRHKAPLVADQLIKKGYVNPADRDVLLRKLHDPGEVLDILFNVAEMPKEAHSIGKPAKAAAVGSASAPRSSAFETFANLVNGGQ